MRSYLTALLRLIRHRDETRGVTIVVEGRLVDPWIGVLRQECADAMPNGPVALDLSALTYLGPTGVRLLRELARTGVRLDRVPGLIQQMLEPDS